MTALICVAAVLISLICAPIAAWYQKCYITEHRSGFVETLKQQKKMFIILGIIFAAMSVINVILQQKNDLRTDILFQNILIWNGVFTAAVIDYKVKKIPNKIVLVLLFVRAVFLAWGILIEKDSLKLTVLRACVGMVLGGGIILVCMFFSKGGVGAGDMKLFAVIGFCFGLTGLVQVMIYTLFISAVFCIGLLISKKAQMRSTVPMAPFILAGLTVYYLLLS